MVPKALFYMLESTRSEGEVVVGAMSPCFLINSVGDFLPFSRVPKVNLLFPSGTEVSL
jgi:hypothetical protein